MIHDRDIEEMKIEEAFKIARGTDIAWNNNINLTKFKKEISKRLTTNNNEDQWTYDYSSYLLVLSNGIFINPIEWGKEFYPGRWNN